MNRILLGLVLLLTVTLQAKEVIKIGMVVPMTGDMASLGQNTLEGFSLRQKEIPANSRFEYKVIFEDDSFTPKNTAAATLRLKTLEKVQFLGTLWTGCNAAIPLLKDSGIIHISPDQWGKFSDSYPYDFILGPPAESNARATVEALKALGVKRLAILYNPSPGNVDLFEPMDKYLQEAGIKVVERYGAQSDVKDLRGWITQLREKKPDFILHSTFMPMAEIALKQIKEQRLNIPQGCSTSTFQDVSPDLTDRTWCLMPGNPPDAFIESFKKVYGHNPIYPAANAYDTMSVIVQACESLPKNQRPTAEAICKNLRGLKDFPGVLGSTSYQAPNRLPSPVAYYVFKAGKPVQVSLQELVEASKPNH